MRLDQRIDAADALIVLRASAGLMTPTPVQSCAADMDEDGAVTAGDAVLVLRRAVGLPKAEISTAAEPPVVVLSATPDPLEFELDLSEACGWNLELGYDPALSRFVEASPIRESSGGPVAAGVSPHGRLAVALADHTPRRRAIRLRFESSPGPASPHLEAATAYGPDGTGRRAIVENRAPLPSAEASALPTRPVLMGAHPNPFNASTSIRFGLPARGDVVLTIHDLAGRRVARFDAPNAPAGTSTVVWLATDERGGPVASGVYLLKLWTSAGSDSARLCYVK